MTTLSIRLKRHPDGTSSLSCVRADGTTTWQRQRGGYALVFPSHDLTHFAVETELGFTRGFYGLIAEGWDIEDFASPWPRGPIPSEARDVELLVSFVEMRRQQPSGWTAADFNAELAQLVQSRRELRPRDSHSGVRTLTDVEVESVRTTRDELLRRWGALVAGETLELTFGRR